MLKIGEKIKELRKAQDVTQEKLADYDYIFEMIYDKDDTRFEMMMTFILRGAGFYLSEQGR